ncbi:MAG: glycosyltransferase [Candidatus Kapaibacteriales bacterium]
MKAKPIDVLLLSLNEYQTDARSYNFLETFTKLNLNSVAIFATTQRKQISLTAPNKEIICLKLKKSKKLAPKWIEYYFQSRRLIKNFSPKFVFCEDLYSLPIAYLFWRKYNSKIIYDSREIYSELASLRNKKIKKNIITTIEKKYIPYVDTIIVTGDLDKKILSDKFPTSNIKVVYNYPPRARNLLPVNYFQTLGIHENAIVMIYQGMIFEGRGLELSIKALQFIENAHLILLGKGEYTEKLKELSKSLEVASRTHFLGEVEYSKLLNYTAGANIGLALIEPLSLSYKLALPNKLFEYCQAKIPVIATRLPAIEEIFRKFRIGILVEPNISSENLAETVTTLYENRNSYMRDIEQASKIFVWEMQIPTIEQIIRGK